FLFFLNACITQFPNRTTLRINNFKSKIIGIDSAIGEIATYLIPLPEPLPLPETPPLPLPLPLPPIPSFLTGC
ncbi:MAG TPA: hypothetical protein ACFYD4_14280, partial [Candidatus Wunengus sp. YC61]|uniref:hypothetical protein n=1 Tax=Candidatus Wunengus sp. YC61 TaxID=3367698 RepID=UPI004028A9A8